MKRKTLQILSDDALQALTTPRLLNVLKSARAVESDILSHAGDRCCEFCHEYVGSDYKSDVLDVARPIGEYKARILAILATRGHVPKTPAKPAAPGKKYDVKFATTERFGGRTQIFRERVVCGSTKKIRPKLRRTSMFPGSGIEILEVNGRKPALL